MQILYTFLLYLIQPLIWIRLLLRSRKAPAYRKRWLERYGFCKGKVRADGILLHSVSVGETIAAIPLIKTLQHHYPHLPITVTTMTPTGSERVTTLLGNSVSHVYLPYDLPDAIHRFLNRVRPKLVIIMETELWPNLICQLHKRDIPLIIANARLSKRSARDYAKLGKTMRRLLAKISHIAAQNQKDGKRFIKLGLPKSHLTVTGSIKFDINLTQQQKDKITELKQKWQLKRHVFIAASTHLGEDEMILTAFKQTLKQHPNLLLMLVPRHPERFKSVEKLIAENKFNYQCRSENTRLVDETQVLLIDTMGELIELYGLADIALVGGSLTENGGHNPLEPALHHVPTIMGKHFFNFNVICKQLIDAKGMLICDSNANEISATLSCLLDDPHRAKQIGENGYQVLKQNQGALERLLKLITNYLI